ncbi:MAG: hypothetical protein ACRCVT_15685 [Leadbetterella sp.]
MNSLSLPIGLSVAFLLAMTVTILFITNKIKNNSPLEMKSKLGLGVPLFYVVYFAYVVFIVNLIKDSKPTVPPLLLLYTTLPYGLFLFLYVVRTDTAKHIFSKIALDSLIGVHIFRLMGSVFLFLGFMDALPKPLAVFAGIGDVVTAISSLFVVKALQNQYNKSRTIAYVWNIFGTLDIIITAVLANVYAKIAIDTGVNDIEALSKVPFCLIPAFAPPTILFLHYLIFKKLKKEYV